MTTRLAYIARHPFLPGATAYIGCIGKDQYGKILRTEAENDGYAHAHVRRTHARQLVPVC